MGRTGKKVHHVNLYSFGWWHSLINVDWKIVHLLQVHVSHILSSARQAAIPPPCVLLADERQKFRSRVYYSSGPPQHCKRKDEAGWIQQPISIPTSFQILQKSIPNQLKTIPNPSKIGRKSSSGPFSLPRTVFPRFWVPPWRFLAPSWRVLGAKLSQVGLQNWAKSKKKSMQKYIKK